MSNRDPNEGRDGYKETKIGWIPEDWASVRLGELFVFKNGLNKGKEYFGKGTPIVNYMDVFQLDGIASKDIQGRVTVTNKELEYYSVKKDDVLFTRTSETIDEIGYSAVIVDDVKDTVFSGFVLRARPKKSLLTTHFKKYCFSGYRARKEIITKSSCTTRALTNGKILSEVQIPVPSVNEQEKISSILSTWDVAIDRTQRLIVAKEGLKRGLMQRLLSGEVRFPGFTEKWEESLLKDVIKDFIVPMRDKPKEFKGNIPWCRIEDFNGKYLSDSKSGQYVSPEIIKSMRLKVYPLGTVLCSCSAELGQCVITTAPLVSNQTFIGLVPDRNRDNEFLYYLMKNSADRLQKLSSGTTISYLSRQEFEKFKILMPPNPRERDKIATTLGDVESAIHRLTNIMNLLNKQKQGLMQRLLTGEVRVSGVGS